MSEMAHPQAKALFPLGLLGMLVMLAGIERSIERNLFVFSTPDSALARAAAREAAKVARSCQILCVGDSLIKFGVYPEILEKRLGRSAFNLALSGGQPPAAYFLLQKFLGAGGRPAAIVVDLKANTIAGTPRNNDRQWPEMLSPAECAELAMRDHDFSYLCRLVLSRLLPSYKVRRELRAEVFAALEGRIARPYMESLVFLRNANQHQGAIVVGEELDLRNQPEPMIKATYFPDAWSINRVNAHYIRKFFDLAASKHIPVFLLLAPIDPVMQAQRERLGHDAQYVRMVKGLVENYPNLVVVDGRHMGYTREEFFDLAHLNRRGAVSFSDALARALAPYLDHPAKVAARWVELHSDQGIARNAPLEDLDSSRVVLHLPALTARK